MLTDQAMSPRGRRRFSCRVGRRLVPLVITAVVAVGCTSSTEPSTALNEGAFIEIHHFDDLATMLATSDLVIQGVVTEISEGGIVGEDSEVQFVNLTVRVDETIYGKAPGDHVVVQSTQAAIPYDPEWRERGTEVIAFLVRKQDSGIDAYREVNSQAVFIIDGGADVLATVPDDLTDRLASWGLERFRREARLAADEVEAGRVEPQEPGMFPGPTHRRQG